MATVATIDDGAKTTHTNENSRPPRQKQICFSFAAYAKTLMNNLKSSNVVISEGLSDAEFSDIESKFNITLPPDLRAILSHGLPISPEFPNWRSSSEQQLQILINLPSSAILRRVSTTRLWHPSWGPEPKDPTRVVTATRRILNDAPTLIPIFRHCYIPSSPNVAGNPVFYVDHSGEVRLLSFDLAGFFRTAEFISKENREAEEVPVWAAKSARRIRFWSDMAEEGSGKGWWWCGLNGEVGGCMETALWRLRESGWREEEVREMMMVMDGGDEAEENGLKVKNKEGVVWHVRVLSLVLLRAGWSREDVVDSLGVVGDEGKSWFQFHQDQEKKHIFINDNAAFEFEFESCV